MPLLTARIHGLFSWSSSDVVLLSAQARGCCFCFKYIFFPQNLPPPTLHALNTPTSQGGVSVCFFLFVFLLFAVWFLGRLTVLHSRVLKLENPSPPYGKEATKSRGVGGFYWDRAGEMLMYVAVTSFLLLAPSYPPTSQTLSSPLSVGRFPNPSPPHTQPDAAFFSVSLQRWGQSLMTPCEKLYLQPSLLSQKFDSAAPAVVVLLELIKCRATLCFSGLLGLLQHI